MKQSRFKVRFCTSLRIQNTEAQIKILPHLLCVLLLLNLLFHSEGTHLQVIGQVSFGLGGIDVGVVLGLLDVELSLGPEMAPS